jgi:predicted dehydrogenase
MSDRSVGVVMNGVTGRMGHRQHLERSVIAIRDQGGVALADGSRVQVVPLLVGRDERKLARLAEQYGLTRWSTDLDAALAEPDMDVYFDAALTKVRTKALITAMRAGKHVYTEKPLADTLASAQELADVAAECGVKNGIVHDKLFLPGLQKLRRLVDGGFFGTILSVRGEFGYWVFEGDWQEPQRPSWNYRTEDGGGIVADMFSHWSYVLENLFGQVQSVSAKAVTHIPKRWDEQGQPYHATADDAAYAILELAGGVIAQINSSWCVRVHRDELLEFQVDGTEGSAVAGLHHCVLQHRGSSPKPLWNPDVASNAAFRDQWSEVPDNGAMENGFKAQWEQFVRNVVDDTPHPYDFAAGARGVRLSTAALQSSAEGRRIELAGLAP